MSIGKNINNCEKQNIIFFFLSTNGRETAGKNKKKLNLSGAQINFEYTLMGCLSSVSHPYMFWLGMGKLLQIHEGQIYQQSVFMLFSYEL